MTRAIRAELLKLRRAKTVWGTVGVVASFALMSLFAIRLTDPELANTTWERILDGSTMYMASWWGVLVFGLAAAQLFGAEFSDGTAPSLLTTPVRREYFVVAKMIVLAGWVCVLVLVSVAVHVVTAALVLGFDGFEWQFVFACLDDGLLVAFILYLTLPTIALISMLGRGYLAPMLFCSAVTAASMSSVYLNWERWFPWAMPVTVAGFVGPPGLVDSGLTPGSWAVLAVMFVGGLVAVIWHVDRADFRN